MMRVMDTLGAVYEQDGDWVMAYIQEIPGVNTQGRTVEEARANLRDALAEFLAANRELARREIRAKDSVIEEPFAVVEHAT